MKNIFNLMIILKLVTFVIYCNLRIWYAQAAIIFLRFRWMNTLLLYELKRQYKIFNPRYKTVKPIKVEINKKL